MKQAELLVWKEVDSSEFKLAKNFSRKLFKSFCENICHSQYLRIVENTRIPVERELYGLLASSLFMTTLANEKPLLTEFSISREESKGRIDFVVFYRGTTFLIEFKVARVVSKGMVDDDEDSTLPPLERVAKPWREAYEQLTQDSMEIQLKDVLGVGPVVKLPLVLYLHVDYRGEKRKKESPTSTIATKYILEQLSECGIQDDCLPVFVRSEQFSQPIQTRRRKGPLDKDKADVNLYGFSLMAGCNALWGE